MKSKHGIYVALLRGINVGGNNIVSMAVLKTCFEQLGFYDVQTYINSGNVVFRASATDPRLLESTIEKSLHTNFTHSIVVMVRNYNEVQQLVEHIPPSWQTNSNQKCNVIFLRHTIDSPEICKELSPKPGIEELYYYPGALFWSAKTSDLTKSNMLKVNKMKIYQEMTIRGLNTTLKIYELMRKVHEQSIA